MGLTLREMALIAEGQAKRDKEGWRQRIAAVHLAETLGRTKRLPDLADLLKQIAATPLTPLQKRENFLARMDAMVEATQRKFGKKKK